MISSLFLFSFLTVVTAEENTKKEVDDENTKKEIDADIKDYVEKEEAWTYKEMETFEKYPKNSIVWTPIPIVTWFFPFIGHMGITDSNGVVYEFMNLHAQPADGLSFGPVTRYIPFEEDEFEKWADAITHGRKEAYGKVHGVYYDNCHYFVADTLNHRAAARGDNSDHWNQVTLATDTFFKGTYTSTTLMLYHIVPSALIYGGAMYLAFTVWGHLREMTGTHIPEIKESNEEKVDNVWLDTKASTSDVDEEVVEREEL